MNFLSYESPYFNNKESIWCIWYGQRKTFSRCCLISTICPVWIMDFCKNGRDMLEDTSDSIPWTHVLTRTWYTSRYSIRFIILIEKKKILIWVGKLIFTVGRVIYQAVISTWWSKINILHTLTIRFPIMRINR